MSIDAITTASSDAGAPMAGAVDPSSARRISELGTNAQVPPGMQRLDGPEPQAPGEVKPFDPAAVAGNQEQMIDLEAAEAEGVEAAPDLEPPTPEADPAAPTPEQLAQEYKEFLENPELDIEKYGDKVFWYDSDGKGQMVPIRIKDIPNNILLYNDYQRKTTEVAEYRRHVERKENGQKAFLADMQSEDPQVQLRAARQMMNQKTFEAMVLQYIDDRAAIEKLPPQVQQRLLNEQKIADENFYLRRQAENLQRMQQQQQQQQQQELQQQGTSAPDITFVQETIIQTLPKVQKELGIPDEEYNSPNFQLILDQVFTQAATGERNADGSWKSAPTIQRGRAPSANHIKQLLAHTKQRVDSLYRSPHAKRLAPPRKVATSAPLNGSGPSPGQGQRGNISAPARMRWSDMGKQR